MLGCVATPGSNPPSEAPVVCVHSALVEPCRLRFGVPLPAAVGTESSELWGVANQCCTFVLPELQAQLVVPNTDDDDEWTFIDRKVSAGGASAATSTPRVAASREPRRESADQLGEGIPNVTLGEFVSSPQFRGVAVSTPPPPLPLTLDSFAEGVMPSPGATEGVTPAALGAGRDTVTDDDASESRSVDGIATPTRGTGAGADMSVECVPASVGKSPVRAPRGSSRSRSRGSSNASGDSNAEDVRRGVSGAAGGSGGDAASEFEFPMCPEHARTEHWSSFVLAGRAALRLRRALLQTALQPSCLNSSMFAPQPPLLSFLDSSNVSAASLVPPPGDVCCACRIVSYRHVLRCVVARRCRSSLLCAAFMQACHHHGHQRAKSGATARQWCVCARCPTAL